MDYKDFLMERVVRPLMVIQRHSVAVYAPFYTEIIPLALRTTNTAALDAIRKQRISMSQTNGLDVD